MNSFSYTKKEGFITVVTPYNPKFVQKARNMRGVWRSDAWHFDDSIEEYVKSALMECYGTTGEAPVSYCTLIVKDFSDTGDKDAVILFDRTVAKAFGRDTGARLGDDIIFISGEYSSGGSVKNWRTYVNHATFQIQNFPLPRTEFEDVKKAISEGWCELKLPIKKRPQDEIKKDIEKYSEILEKLKLELDSI